MKRTKDGKRHIVPVPGKKGMYREEGASEVGSRVSSIGESAEVLSRPVPSLSSTAASGGSSKKTNGRAQSE